MSDIEQFETDNRFTARERLALRYADRIMLRVGEEEMDRLFEDLKQEFSPSDLVELGALIACNIGFSGHVYPAWGL